MLRAVMLFVGLGLPTEGVAQQLVVSDVRQCIESAAHNLVETLTQGQSITNSDQWKRCRPVQPTGSWQLEATYVIDSDQDGQLDEQFQVLWRQHRNGRVVWIIRRSVLALEDPSGVNI